jgi:hypothetical protein
MKMTKVEQAITLGSSVTYEIEVQGYLEEHWSDWLDNMVIVPQVVSENISITRLSGKVVDQASLHGLLRKLYDLGLPLLSVSRIKPDQTKMADIEQ